MGELDDRGLAGPRVCYVIDNLNRGGTQKVLRQLAQGLSERGYQQTVLCLNQADPDVVEALHLGGARVEVLGRWGLLTGAAQRRALAHLWQADIAQTFLFYSDVLGRTWARAARVPVIVSSLRAVNYDKKPWQLWLDRRTAGLADRVIINAEEIRPFCVAREGVRPDQVHLIHNGVEIPEPLSEDARENLRHALKVPAGAPLLASAGRLRPQKGFSTLLQAMPAILRQHPQARLLIAGEGPLAPILEAQARALGIGASVSLLGRRCDLPRVLGASDLFVLPSLWEGMPNILMEAMAAGLPCVATQVSGVPELIPDARHGLLVPPGDSEHLAMAVVQLLGEPSLRRELGEAGRRRMARDFGVANMVGAFDQLYQGLLVECAQRRPARGRRSWQGA
ncbi:MAG TPA: glycosyltransferase [Armatimonadota bacterium]|jgi:glycosyltransferase involved in cell wall biosynthesis